jgi:hypothetical protein
MRDFIILSEGFIFDPEPETEMVPEPIYETRHPIIDELGDLVFRLRSIMEDSDGDYGLGVEMGLQRAAEMIETIIKRHED